MPQTTTPPTCPKFPSLKPLSKSFSKFLFRFLSSLKSSLKSCYFFFKVNFSKFLVFFVVNWNKGSSQYVREFVFIIIFFGLILSTIFHTLFGFKFSVCRLLGFGFMGYLIKVELPDLISSCFGRKYPPHHLGGRGRGKGGEGEGGNFL